jgi:hypothetical protein
VVEPLVLYPRRLAYRALGVALDRFHLGVMLVKLNPDDPTQALPGNAPGEIWFYEDFARGAGPIIATVLLEETRARVIVERLDRLIRRNHLRDFRPAELGIARRDGLPDVDAVVDLTEVIEVEGTTMRTAKQRVLPPASRPRRAPQAIRAFGSSR